MTTAPEFSLKFERYVVGAIRFPHAQQLNAIRTTDGIALTIPAEIELSNHKNVTGRALVSDLRAIVASFSEQIGVAEDIHLHASVDREELALVLRMPAGVIRTLEARRDGGPIVLALHVTGRLCVIRDVALFRRSWDDLNEIVEQVLVDDQPVVRGVQGEPVRVNGTATVTLDPLVWSTMLKATGFGENVFVEIPLPPSPGPPWDEVWKALRAARDALNRGGSMAWKTVVSECRVALEKWEKIEGQAVDHGEGGLAANRDQREARTVKQRHDALRWHTHQLAHYFQHNHADECTRDDAVLVLATLAGLLAVRKP